MMPLDHIPPPDRAKLRCRCRYIGMMNVRQTEYGNGHDTEDRWEATCPKCSRRQLLWGDEVSCNQCGLMDDPDRMGDWRHERLCVWCWHREWEAWVTDVAKRVVV